MPRHVTESWRDYLGPGAVSSFLVAGLAALVGLGLPVLFQLGRVLRAARRDERDPADAILVLGRALHAGDRPSPVFRARLEHGLDLWRRGVAPRLIVAGGLTGRAQRTEAEVGREVLCAAGAPGEAVLCEGSSRHTLENLVNVRETLRSRGWRRLVMVSDPLHQARISALARGLGVEHGCSPAPEAAPTGGRWVARALREAFLLHWYHTGKLYSRMVGSQRNLGRVT